MTVKELYEKLGKLMPEHSDTRVIANCEFTINGDYYENYCLLNLNDVYYQSGDIELGFTNDR